MKQEESDEVKMTLAEKLRAYVPWVFAGIILLGYAWFIFHLLGKTEARDEVWVKLTYIFSSVEAIVFTAVGFIFGREVNRSRALEAEKKIEKVVTEKKELAKEVLKNVPQPPSSPDSPSEEIHGLQKLRSLAEIHLQ